MPRSLEGWSKPRSHAVVAFGELLFDHPERRKFLYEHLWRQRDLLLWDNRCTRYARTDFSAAERRLMRRVTILGERPV